MRSRPCLTIPGHSPVQEVDKKARSQTSDGVDWPIFAYFRVFWPYFRESNTKIRENKRKLSVVE